MAGGEHLVRDELALADVADVARKAEGRFPGRIAKVGHPEAVLLYRGRDPPVVAPSGALPMLVDPQRGSAVTGFAADAQRDLAPPPFFIRAKRWVAQVGRQSHRMAIQTAARGRRRPAIGVAHGSLHLLAARADKGSERAAMSVDGRAVAPTEFQI